MKVDPSYCHWKWSKIVIYSYIYNIKILEQQHVNLSGCRSQQFLFRMEVFLALYYSLCIKNMFNKRLGRYCSSEFFSLKMSLGTPFEERYLNFLFWIYLLFKEVVMVCWVYDSAEHVSTKMVVSNLIICKNFHRNSIFSLKKMLNT